MDHDMKITTCGKQIIILFDPKLIKSKNSVWPSWTDRLSIEKLTNCVINWDESRNFTDITKSIGKPCLLIAYDIIKNNNKKTEYDLHYTDEELIEIARSITAGPEGIA